jgi:hypothetical protein
MARMHTWAGADQMRDIQRPSGRARRLVGVRTYRQEPAPNSVHLVDTYSGKDVCGGVDPATLTRLGQPWSEWPGRFRCHRYHELHPMD